MQAQKLLVIGLPVAILAACLDVWEVWGWIRDILFREIPLATANSVKLCLRKIEDTSAT